MASNLPVEAPEGAAAVPMVPSVSCTVALTVGLPRESKISVPNTFWIRTILVPPCHWFLDASMGQGGVV